MQSRAFFLIFFCLTFSIASCYGNSTKDSLITELNSSTEIDEKYLSTFNQLIDEISDPLIIEEYADSLIWLAQSIGSSENLIRGLIHKGNADKVHSNYENALNSFFDVIKHCDKSKYGKYKGMAEFSIADIYSESGNSQNAISYYNKALETLINTDDQKALASAYLNAGDEYLNIEQYEKSIDYFKQSIDIFEKINYEEGLAFNYGNMGMAYASIGKKKLAEEQMNKAIVILEDLNELYPISVYLNYLADIYVGKGDLDQALNYAKRSLFLAKQHSLKKEIGGAHLKLSELYELDNKKDEAYHHYKQHIVYRDSIYNVETAEELANQRTEFEVSQKQVALDLETEKRRSQQIISSAVGGIALLIGFLAFALFRNNKIIKKTSKIIQEERDKSEKLLLNILPSETADELKEKGKVTAKRYENASVLFADFVGFTKYAAELTPEALVSTIDHYFTRFDEIMDNYGLEKIKTIGDAYMVASGLPTYAQDHTINLVKAAVEMRTYVQEQVKKAGLEDALNIRIGINSGPVVAGVVGSSKFAYDIWGDTVNTASRLESHSVPGKINISDSTYQLVKDHFLCEKRQPMEVKSKGYIDMYFIDSFH